MLSYMTTPLVRLGVCPGDFKNWGFEMEQRRGLTVKNRDVYNHVELKRVQMVYFGGYFLGKKSLKLRLRCLYKGHSKSSTSSIITL